MAELSALRVVMTHRRADNSWWQRADLACLSVLDGVPPGEAVAYVRVHYDHRAVETPCQRRFVRRFAPDPGSGQRRHDLGVLAE
jgi:hypothetical protein